jgi:hypothetical protein
VRKFYPWQRRTDFVSKALLVLSVKLSFKLSFWRDKPHYAPALIKVPLVKWQTGCKRLTSHIMVKPPQGQLATATGALLHFKFFADFHEKAKHAVSTGQKFRGSQEYGRYLLHVRRNPEISFMYRGSRKYMNSNSLLAEGLIKTSPALDSYVQTVTTRG